MLEELLRLLKLGIRVFYYHYSLIIFSWPKIPDVAPAKRQRLSHISETNMAIRFTKKCMERKNIIEDRIISGVPVTFPKLESVRRNNRDPML